MCHRRHIISNACRVAIDRAASAMFPAHFEAARNPKRRGLVSHGSIEKPRTPRATCISTALVVRRGGLSGPLEQTRVASDGVGHSPWLLWVASKVLANRQRRFRTQAPEVAGGHATAHSIGPSCRAGRTAARPSLHLADCRRRPCPASRGSRTNRAGEQASPARRFSPHGQEGALCLPPWPRRCGTARMRPRSSESGY
jgi:hypothetical protein